MELLNSDEYKPTVDGKKDGGNGKVRRATFDDLDAIMDINDNVYDSFDYMPSLFYTFMHSKLYAIYVYEEDGKLISLSNFRFYPECDDLVTWMSIRVRPSHQGRGFGSSESSPLIHRLLVQHPNVTRYALGTMYKPDIKAKIHKRELIYQWNYLLYKLSDRQWLTRSTPIHQMALGPLRPFTLSYTRATEWLEQSDQLVRFVSKYAEDFIPVGTAWMPIPISKSGLRGLFLESNVMVSFSSTVKLSSDQSIPADSIPIPGKIHLQIEGSRSWMMGDKEELSDEIVGLSYSTALQCKYGITIDFYFYGECENVLLSHVYNHLLHYVSVTLDDVRFGVSLNFPLTINVENVEKRLKGAMGEKVTSDYYSATQAVLYITKLPTAKL